MCTNFVFFFPAKVCDDEELESLEPASLTVNEEETETASFDSSDPEGTLGSPDELPSLSGEDEVTFCFIFFPTKVFLSVSV